VQVPQSNSGQCGNYAPGIQSSGVCRVVTACGGQGQRACCVGESASACQSGLAQVPQANSGYCGNSSVGLQSSGVCQVVTACGGTDQRACCVGEAGFGACQGGLVEVPQSNSGQCGNYAPGIQSSGVCRTVTACGGQGQRACCVGESASACQSGLVQLPQPNSGYCGNSSGGIQSSGVCQAVTACGGTDQRACCAGEAGFGACQGGLVEVPQSNSGQCGNYAPGIQSSGVCRTVTACGGQGQRACCAGEAGFGACQSGLAELPQPNSGYCGNSSGGIQSSGVCQAVTACGGAGERACCIGEAGFGACQSGLAETPLPNTGQCANALPGIQSSGWCTPIEACGAKGQRACCVGEGTACQAGLIEVPGCSGNCACGGGLASSGMCTVIEAIAEPSTAWSAPPAGPPALRGYADLHLHLFSHLAHGGGVLHGKPYDAVGGINESLKQDYGTNLDLVSSGGGELPAPTCPSFLPSCGAKIFHGDHPQIGAGSDTLGAGTKDGGDRFLFGAESNLGAPIFNGWPVWTTTTHQQAYHVWLERAWRGGLRLVVMLAVNNEALCQTHKRLRGTDCANGMASIDAQLNEAYLFQSFIDARAGGTGLGWFRIVRTPEEARAAIAAGKMAVVLGIEMDNLFNCKWNEQDPSSGVCTEETVRQWVNQAYAKGVRHVFPIHNFDNAFGSPATWQDVIHVGNFGVEERWWELEDCPGEGYGFKVADGFFTGFANAIMALFGFGQVGAPPTNAGDASCNKNGLTEFGVILTHQLMQRGMLIDVDHMSRKSLGQTLAIAEAMEPKYPVVASHVQFFDLNEEPTRHERMRTREDLERIRGVGGMVAAMLKDDQQDTDNIGQKYHVPYGTITDDCRHSSKTWAQMYQYAVDVMGGPVAFGSDFNGAAGHIGPRFGSEACGGDTGLLAFEWEDRIRERRAQVQRGDRLAYPFTLDGFGTFQKQQTGHKTFDYNVDGLAHVGLLPDLVADLQRIGMSPNDLDPLWRSAEGYIEVWERALVAAPEPDGAALAVIALATTAALHRRRRAARD
jgi:microsomal dipeptidase-like Zn-dependent dipeptidase